MTTLGYIAILVVFALNVMVWAHWRKCQRALGNRRGRGK